MLTFDINQSPPTRQEIEQERERLTRFRKQLIKQSVCSDSIHGSSFFLLYYFDLMSGYALLAVIGLATVIALVLISSLKRLRTTDLMTVAFVAIAAAFAVGGMVYGFPDASVLGSVLAAVVTGSVVMFSTLIGRMMLRVFNGLEELKSLVQYDDMEQEMLRLCRENPPLEDYRQEALQILRPNLTLGELKAMREWANR